MKNKHIILPTVFFAIIALISCQTRSTLTADISGTWTSVPESISANDTTDIDLIKTFEFIPTSDTSGDIIISGMISIGQTVPHSPVDTTVTPHTVTAAAVASVRGTFEATSYDNIAIKLDRASFSFTIDPEAITIHFNRPADRDSADIKGLQEKYLLSFRDTAARAVRENFLNVTEISAIKQSGSIATGNIGDTPATLRRQPTD